MLMLPLLPAFYALHPHVVVDLSLNDHNVVASESTAGFQRDYPGSRVYYYPGGHGASIDASPSALEDFLNHLAPH